MGKALSAIAGALKDVVFGRLTLLALINLVLAGVIAGSAVVGAIRYIAPLIHEGEGWIGFLLDTAQFLVGAGATVLAIALSPAASMFVGGLLFDFAAERVEKAIGAPATRKTSLLGGVANGVRIAIPALFLNLLAAPLYLIPGVNAVVFYTLNGYLMGREYSMLAGTRRMPWRDALRLRRSARFSVFLTGLACSIVPFIAPLIAASAMTRLMHTLASRRA
jgi:uncharacterized protein involved in cysteine biosynthesis